MQALQRITTEYVDTEDRIRLSGACEGEASVQLWMTRRLMDRLLPLLLDWLGRDAGEGARADIMQEFAQTAAREALVPLPSVQVTGDRSVLVQAVDITRGENAVCLVFKPDVSPDVECWGLTFEALPLRQWLGIVHEQYRKADWPLGAWPSWITAVDSVPAVGAQLH